MKEQKIRKIKNDAWSYRKAQFCISKYSTGGVADQRVCVLNDSNPGHGMRPHL